MQIKSSFTGFKSFSITLNVQTEEEARALYHIFNHSRNCALMPAGSELEVRNEILKLSGLSYPCLAENSIIANDVTYSKFYS